MKLRRLAVLFAAQASALLLAVGLAQPAHAVTLDEKVAVLSSWTQPNSTSLSAWNAARADQTRWSEYGFDWSTDYCSTSPDQPLGFDFRVSCWRHDFGYRNYKSVDQFAANRIRVDDAFYFDLKAKCATYNAFIRPACYSLAWTYYQAVRTFGGLFIDQAALNHAAALKAQGEATAAKRAA